MHICVRVCTFVYVCVQYPFPDGLKCTRAIIKSLPVAHIDASAGFTQHYQKINTFVDFRLVVRSINTLNTHMKM